MTSPLELIYEKYKHLDGPLSDTEWCTSGEGAAIYAIAGELWRAVKEARENPCEGNGCTDIENCDEICKHSRIYSQIQMQQAIAQATKKARETLAESKHPSKEYIITEDQLKKYEGLFFLDDEAQEDFKIIRSRQYVPAQPEPTESDPE